MIYRIINELKEPKLYHLYFVSIILGIILAIFQKDFYDSFYATLAISLMIILWIIPTIYDTYKLFSKASVKFILIIGTTTIGFLYTIAQIPAKEHIRNIVNYFPDSYTIAINFFAVFYTLPLFVLSIIAIFCIVFMLFFLITILIDMLKEIILIHVIYQINEIVKQFYDRLAQFFGFYHSFHMFMYSIGIIITLSIFSNVIGFVSVVFLKYQQHIMHYTSYYKNNEICKNIDSNFYIHNVGDNKVSISPFVGNVFDLQNEFKRRADNFTVTECK